MDVVVILEEVETADVAVVSVITVVCGSSYFWYAAADAAMVYQETAVDAEMTAACGSSYF